eukprot:214712_1
MLLLSLDDYSPRKLMLRGDFPQARAFPFNSANKLQKAPKRKYTQKLIVLKVNIGMFLRNKMATKPRRGVFQLRAPSEIIKRTVRGMITSRTKREWSTLKNMKNLTNQNVGARRKTSFALNPTPQTHVPSSANE